VGYSSIPLSGLRSRLAARSGRDRNRLYLSSTEIAGLIDALTELGGQANRTVYSTSTPEARLQWYPMTAKG
jgi:hypothetical protein